VQAVASEVAEIIEALPTKAERDAASQFCGWFVGQIMRRLGYRVVQERGRVTGASFKTGAGAGTPRGADRERASGTMSAPH
jgi:hypothetical protein